MSEYRLPLTKEETALVQQIDLSGTHQSHAAAHDAYLKNQEPILALLSSLEQRNAISEHWIRYWTDPAYNPGRIKASRQGLFERNGCSGTDIYIHPNFIRHLRYLLFGSELLDHIRSAFMRETGDPQWVSSSDAITLGKYARKQVRENGMIGATAAEEFFKLALDIGLNLAPALVVMESVKQVR